MSPVGTKIRGTGVGCICREPIKIINVCLKTRKARQLYEQGAMALYVVSTGTKNIMIGNVYGETGGHQKEAAAQKTDGRIEAIVNELAEHEKMPTCIVGDLNAEPEDIPMVTHMLQHETWTDCGAAASMWGGTDRQPTVEPRFEFC